LNGIAWDAKCEETCVCVCVCVWARVGRGGDRVMAVMSYENVGAHRKASLAIY